MREVGGSSPSSPIQCIAKSQQHLRPVGAFAFSGGVGAWCQTRSTVGELPRQPLNSASPPVSLVRMGSGRSHGASISDVAGGSAGPGAHPERELRLWSTLQAMAGVLALTGPRLHAVLGLPIGPAGNRESPAAPDCHIAETETEDRARDGHGR
jgi:hypothetical protein